MLRLINILIAITLLIFSLQANAIETSRPLPGDSRLRVITYNPTTVHKYTGFYNYEASILFGEGEEIKTISMGNPSAWQMVPSGRRLFLKPVADNPDDATTNALIITNKRTYHFIFSAAEVGEDGINDPNLVWETSFVYPDDDNGIVHTSKASTGPDLTDPSKYNFNYTISGSDYIAPKKIFDDGQFTYFQFKKEHDEVPAFFLVDAQGHEALINYRVEGDYIVVERIASQFTLRHGQDVTCVFNEHKPFVKPIAKKKKKKGWFSWL